MVKPMTSISQQYTKALESMTALQAKLERLEVGTTARVPM
jgi:hypothetical protein